MSDPTPLVGRDDVLEVLSQHLEAAGQGQPSLAVLRGEAGIGKSRVAAALADTARAHGALVLLGHCTPVSGAELAFGPFVEMVGSLTTERSDAAPAAVIGAFLDGDDVATPTSLQDRGLARSRLFAGMCRLLSQLSHERPIVVVIEDVHWADASSLDLLSYLVRTLREERVLLLATVRDADLDRAEARAALAELARLERCTHMTLAPLTAPDIETLVRTAHPDLSPTHAHRVTTLCDGNPFFALELARHPDVSTVAPVVQDVLLASLAGLSQDAHAVLRVAAVLGETVRHGVLEACAVIDGDFGAAVRELLNRDVLVVEGDGYRIRHALVREVVVGDLTPGELLAAHRVAAAGLRSVSASDRYDGSARLAHHLVAAGETTAALPVALAAARHARDVYAFIEARLHYDTVRRLWADVPDAALIAGASYTVILCEEADTAAWSAGNDVVVAALRQAVGATSTTSEDRARLHLALGRTLWAAGDAPGALDSYERADAALGSTDDDGLRASIQAALANGLLVNGYLARAHDVAAEGVALAHAAGAAGVELHARVTRATAIGLTTDVVSATRELHDCVSTAKDVDDFTALVRGYGNLVHVLVVAGRLDDAVSVAECGAADCERFGPLVLVVPTMLENWLYALCHTGRWTEAEALAEGALAQSPAQGMGLVLHHALAQIAVARGDDELCARHLSAARMLAPNDDPATVHDGAVIRAEHALWHGDAATAESEVTAALVVVGHRDQRELVVDLCRLALWALGDAATALPPGRETTMGEVVERADDFMSVATSATRSDDRGLLATMSATCAAEHARVRRADAPGMWDEVAEAWKALHHPYLEAQARWRLAAAHFARHARAKGTEALLDALHLATRLGCDPLTAELRRLATYAGVDLTTLTVSIPDQAGPVDDVSPAPTLTARERQVLALVAEGYTNRRIARTLFITEKTASVHVSNIIAKLGVTNRVEAAAAAHALQLLPAD